MSYCRWSCDDYQCDLYCYADVMGGYTIHVAAYRYIFKEPLPPFVPFDNIQEWLERDQKISRMLEKAEKEKIGLEFAGETFNEKTPHDFLVRLLMLRKAGYKFPDDVLDAVKEEIDNIKE